MRQSAADATCDDAATGRRRGRPPATDSADTRQKIFHVARCLFAERGYGAVTNKDVASAAGITPGALYHYVESKLDLYVQVDVDMQRTIHRRFQEALASAETFIGKFSALLEAAYQLGVDHPAAASFVGAVRTDMRRHPEVAERLAKYSAEREQFFVDVVDVGVATGEIAPADKPLVVAFVRAVLIGLTETGSEDPRQYRQAIDGVVKLLEGTLLTAPTH